MSIGVNLAGAEFGSQDRYGTDYIYPGAEDLDYFASKGVDLVRLSFTWERMQPDLGGPLNEAELSRMKTFLGEAAEQGTKVVIDLHNFGCYGGHVLDTAELPISSFADFWSKLATALSGTPGLAGYGLMNEPHDMGSATAWPDSAQAAIDAIRVVDAQTCVYVAGDSWSSAARWGSANPGFPLSDPAGKIVYEAHLYFDRDQSGRYEESYDARGAYPDLGADMVKPFLDWLAATGSKGFIGEFGVPNDDPRWLEVMDRFLKAVNDAGVSGTYWAAGPWWGDYKLSVQPTADGRDKPQMDVLEKYVGDGPSHIDLPPVNSVPGPLSVFEDVAVLLAGIGVADPDSTALQATVSVAHGTLTLGSSDSANAKVADAVSATLTLSGTAAEINHALETLVYQGAHDYFGGDTLTFVTRDRSATATSTVAITVVPVEDVPTGLTLVGTSGKDLLTGDGGADTLSGLGGADALYGKSGDDRLSGGDGNDTLDGGAGADRMEGGTGNDSYVVDDPGDVVIELTGQGADTVTASVDFTLGANVENLTLSGGAVSATGNSLNNMLIGNALANTIDGGAGQDKMLGLGGDDTYIVDNTGDKVTEAANQGTDTIRSSVTYTAPSNVERIELTGAGSINATGNTLDNDLVGNAGNNILSGGTGADTLTGGAGADNVLGGTGNDRFIESLNSGNDSYDGGVGTDTLDFSGVTAAVQINLNAGSAFSVQTGADKLASIENAIGGSGNDVITAGIGANVLTGGEGTDTFVFLTTGAAGNGSSRDVIQDFQVGDKIDLSGIDAHSGLGGDQVFTSVAFGTSFTGEQQIRYFQTAVGGVVHTIVQGNVNSNTAADFQIDLVGAHNLTTADFIL